MSQRSHPPVLGAPMAGGPTTPELVAAVNIGGGLGFLSAGYLSAEQLTQSMQRTRELTADPIGVNLFVPGSPEADRAAIEAYARTLAPEARRLRAHLGEPTWDDDHYLPKIEVIERSGVSTVSFTFGVPGPDVVTRLHAAGARLAVTVTGRAEAELALEAGADLLVVQGTEAGGHQAGFDPGSANHTRLVDALAAIRPITDRLLIGAGGIMTAADAATAQAAGADAVQVGTALLTTPQAGTSALHRRALADARFQETVLTRAFSGRWARGLANRFTRDHADAPTGYPQLNNLTRPLRAAAARADDPELASLWAGTGWRSVTGRHASEVVSSIALAFTA